jgi:lysophospholipase
MARTIDKEDPKLYMGAATNNWLLEALKMGRKIYRNRKKVESVPILMFQAGMDEFSKEKRQQKFCKKHPLCTLKRFENSKHEMFQEKDSIRNEVISMTKSFLMKHLK